MEPEDKEKSIQTVRKRNVMPQTVATKSNQILNVSTDEMLLARRGLERRKFTRIRS